MQTKINERNGMRLVSLWASLLRGGLLQKGSVCFRFQMILILTMVLVGPTSGIGLDLVIVASGRGVTYQQDEPPGSDEAVIDEELKSKALRYHQALQRRPTPGFLLDRFVDAWLEFSTLSDLEQFLQQQVETNNKTNDQTLLALFYAKQGDDVKALAQFQTALANDPGSAATWFEKASVAARTLDFDTAFQDLKRAAELHAAASSPDKELGLNIAKQQASLLVRSSRIADATLAWETLLAANPADELLMEDIVEQQIGEGLFEQALGTTERLVAITKDPYQLVMRRMRQGDILQRSGKQPEALQVYADTLPRVGRDTWLERELIAQIAELFRREDNFIGLKEQFEKLIAAEPDRLALHKGLARTLADIGQSDEAIAALEKVVELTPGDRANRETLISALAKAGQLDAAVAQQEALIGQFPNDPELSIGMAGYQKQLGLAELARTAIQDYLKKAGNSEAAYLRAARVSDSFGWSEETRKLYQECLERFADSSVAREAYGSWLYQQSDKKAALELWLQMATGTDKTELLRIARQLAQRNEHATVITLLTGRLDSFDTDPNYMGQLIESSLATKQFAETIPWLRRRAMISRTSTEMESTIAQGTIVFRRLEQPLAFLDALRGDVFDSTGAIRATGLGAACLLSELLELSGDSVSADQMLTGFEAGLSTSPDTTSAIEVLGAQRIRLWSMRRDWAQAAEAARKLVEMPGGRQSVHLRRLVELYMRDGQPEQALAWTAQWKNSSPGSVTPWVTEAQLLSRLNREDESLRVLRQAARRFPLDADLAAMLAEKYTNAGQAREAERIYWRQFEQSQDPTDRLRWVEQLARISMELGKTDELVALFRERQKSNPESIEPLLSLALVYREADNYEDRRAVLMEASRKQPENLQLLLETARLEESSGDWQDAIATLERAMPLDPSGKVARQLAKISFTFGDAGRGLQLLKNQINDPSIGPREVESLIDSLLHADQWEVARELMLPQLARWPDDWRLAYIQGVIELHLQANDAAREIFHRLLVVDNDLSGFTKSMSGPSYGRFTYGGPSYEMPTGLQVYRTLQFRADEPLAHEQRDSYQRYGGGFLMLPDDAQVCRYYALLQLVFLNAEDGGDRNDDRLEIVRVTGAGGFENADMYFDLLLGASPDGRRVRPDFSDELFERYRDRTDFCLLYAFLNLENDVSPDEDKLMGVISKFEEQYPGPAFACLARFASRDFETSSVEVKAKLTALLDRLAESKINYFLLESSGHLLQGEASELPEGLREIRSKLAQMFAKWHNSMDGNTNPMVHSGLASVVINSAIENRSATQVVELLERELDRATQQVASSNASMTRYGSRYSPHGYGSEEELIEPLPFPPIELLQVPDAFSMFWGYMIRNPRFYDDEPIADEEAGSEFLGQVIQQTSRPFLKAFLQSLDGQWRERNVGEERDVAYADAKATLESLVASEPKNWNALVLAASLATHQQRWDDVSALLERMAALPLSQDQRMTVDAAAVAGAVKGLATDLDQPEHAALVATARNAALRLRRHQLDQSQRYELMMALESLKLNEEAGQMESRLSQANSANAGGTQSVPGMAVPMFRNIRSEPVDPIVKLLREDKKDAALRMVAQNLNQLAKRRLSSIEVMGDYDYEQSQFTETINKLDLGSSLVEHLLQTSPEKLELLGFAHELFGDTAQSIDFYQQYVDANPGRAAVRLRCLLLKLKESPNDFEQHLQDLNSFDAKSMREVGPQLLMRLQAGPIPLALTYAQRMRVLELLIGKAEQDSIEKLENAAWLAFAWSVVTAPTTMAALKSEADVEDRFQRSRPEAGLEQLFSGVDGLANRLPHLYKPRSKNEVTSEELPTQELKDWHSKLANAQQQRVAIHDRLTKLMLQIPQTAESAFSHWLAIREAQERIESSSAVELAKTALDNTAKLRGGQAANATSAMNAQQQAMQQMNQIRNGRGSFNDDAETGSEGAIPLRTPVQYLTRQLATERSAANDSQIAEIAAALRKLRRNDLAIELERRYELQVATPEEFAAVVARLTGDDKKARQSNAPSTAALCMEIYSERNLDVDLLPTLFDLTRDAVQENAWGRVEQLRPIIGQYLSLRSRTSGPSNLLGALSQFAQILCGDAERQTALIAKYGGKSSMPPTRGDGAAYESYVQTLEEFAQFPELGIPVMLEVARFKAYNYVSVRHYADGYGRILANERDSNKVLAYLEMGSFLSGIDDFDPIPWSDEKKTTVLGTFYEGLRGNDFSSKRRLLKALKAREQTFGTRLFITILESTSTMPDKSELHKAIKPDLESLKALSDERLAVFATFIKELGESRSY